MEKKFVEKPELLHKLNEMDELICYLEINNPMFKNRSMKIFDWTKGMNVLHDEIPIPDNEIICDICNWNIAIDKPKKIPLLCEITKKEGKLLVKKALCQKCVDKYYPKLIAIGKPFEMKYFKINCPFCDGTSVSDVIDKIEDVDGQWECSNGHQFHIIYIRKV